MNKTIKEQLLLLLKSFGILLLSIFTGFVLLVICYALPNDKAKEHIYDAVNTMAIEDRTEQVYSLFNSPIDNYTNAIIMQQIFYEAPDTSVVDKALLNYFFNAMSDHGVIPNNETLINYVTNNEEAPDGLEFFTVDYGRYWNGFLLYAKLMLTLFDWPTLRMINFTIQLLLVIWAFTLLRKYPETHNLSIPFLICYGMLIPTATGRCLQMSNCFFLYVIGTIVLLLFKDKLLNKNNIVFYFLVLGICTAYFDFLTYPMVSLGMPMVIYITLTGYSNIKDTILNIIQKCIFWGIGYAGMWSSKWLLATSVTGVDVLKEATDEVAYRTSIEYSYKSFNYITIILEQFYGILNPFSIIAAVFGIVCLIIGIKKHSIDKNKVITLFIIALIPIAWFTVTTQHCSYHYFFACKNLIVSGFAFMAMFLSSENN